MIINLQNIIVFVVVKACACLSECLSGNPWEIKTKTIYQDAFIMWRMDIVLKSVICFSQFKSILDILSHLTFLSLWFSFCRPFCTITHLLYSFYSFAYLLLICSFCCSFAHFVTHLVIWLGLDMKAVSIKSVLYGHTRKVTYTRLSLLQRKMPVSWSLNFPYF